MGDYSSGDEASLPGTSANLDHVYDGTDLANVGTNDTNYVDQTGSSGYELHQYKDSITATSASVTWKGKSSLAPSSSKVQLQVYKVAAPAGWEDVSGAGASNNVAAADTDFTLTGTIATADYLDTGVTTFRIYQSASGEAQWTWLTNFDSIDDRITKDGTWKAVDLGSNNDVPSGTTGVLLRLRNTTITGYKAITRAYTSTDDRSASAGLGGQRYKYEFAPLDSSRRFYAFIEGADANSIKVEIIAYTTESSSQFLADGLDRTPTTSDPASKVYYTVDCSATIPSGGKAAFLQITDTVLSKYALRQNGLTYDYYTRYNTGPGLVIVGVDTNRYFDGSVQWFTDFKAWLQGYSLKFTAISSPVDAKPAATGAWTNCADISGSVPSGALGVVVQLFNAHATSDFSCALRKDGSTDAIYDLSDGFTVISASQMFAYVGVANSVFEAYVSDNTDLHLYVVGYISG